jgi:hypothetical protein
VGISADRKNQPMGVGTMEIPQEVADKMMVRCGRRCCICRRFRPTKLQVHHLVERSKGGSNEEDNLIVICLSCHSDVHSTVPFTRRFTVDEQKGHRDALIKQVADGILPIHDEDDTDLALSAVIKQMKAHPLNDLRLMPEAAEILCSAAQSEGMGQGSLLMIEDSGGFTIVIGGGNKSIHPNDRRSSATYKRAMQQLASCRLIEDRSYKGTTFDVTYQGYLVADEIMSANSLATEK